MIQNSCPIWGTPAEIKNDGNRNVVWVNSIRAGGTYLITTEAMSSLNAGKLQAPRQKALLTSWLVDQRKLGNKRPEIYRETLTREGEERKGLPIHLRADRLLQYIESEIKEIGISICITRQEMFSSPIAAWSESVNEHEVIYLLNYLCSRGWIKKENEIDHILTVEGYARLAELETTNKESPKCFVAMWFNNATEEAWEKGIKPGIEDMGYDAIRIDKEEHNNKIDDEIIAEIHRSRFIVADFTHGDDGARGGVYYEAGYAKGLGLEVIFTCSKDMLDKKLIHFDTRQYNHIAWETPEELRKKLARRIFLTVGEQNITQRELEKKRILRLINEMAGDMDEQMLDELKSRLRDGNY